MVAKTEPASRRPRPNTPESWLRQNGLRVTRARTAMVETLRRSKAPLPLGDVHAALGKAAEAACDFATVFRFFRLLEEKGLVDKQPWVDGNPRYELTPGDSCPGAVEGVHDHHHHFLVCRQCQRTERIEQCLVSRLQTSLGKQTGYREIAHTLQFSGLCPRCQPPAPAKAARAGGAAAPGGASGGR